VALVNRFFQCEKDGVMRCLRNLSPTLGDFDGVDAAFSSLRRYENLSLALQDHRRYFRLLNPRCCLSHRFLLSTHYTHYDAVTFLLNFTSLVVVLVAKLPVMHRVRVFGINKVDFD
jgi:hypothetical protein